MFSFKFLLLDHLVKKQKITMTCLISKALANRLEGPCLGAERLVRKCRRMVIQCPTWPALFPTL